MIKKVKQQQLLIFILSIFYILFLSFFLLYKVHVYNTMTFYLFDFITPLFIYILTPVMISFLTYVHFKKNNNNTASYQYITNNIDKINIPDIDRQNGEKNYHKYILGQTLVKYICICLVVTVGYFYIYFSDIYYIFEDSFYTILLIIVFIIILLAILIFNIKQYQKYYINIIDTYPYQFIYSSYLLLTQHRGSINECQMIYKMNISAALSHIAEYQYAYEYLKSIWNERYKKVNKETLLIINYNSYYFNMRLHNYGQADIYKQETLNIFNSLSKKQVNQKNISMIPDNIQIEELYQNKQWNDIIEYINNHNLDMNKEYYHAMLYISYHHLNDDKANDIYDLHKDHIIFKKLIEQE